MEPEIVDIVIDRPSMELRLTWDDDFGGALGLVALRLACPCAACRGTRDGGNAAWPGAASPQPLGVSDANLVGAWGLSIRWNDGHSTGIFPFDSLRRWCETGHIEVVPDSGMGGT